MQSKLLELVNKYQEITNEQTKVIKRNDIESLNKLIELKGQLIALVQKELMDIDPNSLDEKIKHKILDINNQEKENVSLLKRKQKEITKEANETKSKAEALEGYAKQK
jgi:Fe2+ transport system protein B